MIKVAVLEEDEPYRQTLQVHLKEIADLQIVFTGTHLQYPTDEVTALPDIIIMGISLHKDAGIRYINLVNEPLPVTNILILTVFEDEEKIIDSIKSGANGHLLKKNVWWKIGNAIRKVHNDQGTINFFVARKILSHFQKLVKSTINLEDYHFTNREKEILFHLMNGLSYKDIAATCFVSVETINSHIKKIYAKLNVRSRAEIFSKLR